MRRACVFESTSGQHVVCFTAGVGGDQLSFGMLCMHVVEIGHDSGDIRAPSVYLYKVHD